MTLEQIFDIVFDEAKRQGVQAGTFGSRSESIDQGSKYRTKEEFKDAFLDECKPNSL